MRYVLGIDGGQTTTTAVLTDETGRLLGHGLGGPANHIHEPGGVERIRQSLTDAISSARLTAGLTDAPIACAYLGMTGGSKQMEEVCRPVVPSDQMVLGHDSLIALYSVTYGRPGIVVIGGTGSVGFGRDARGNTARTGGWGYVFGDEGSGYWIAVRALNACVRALDGIGSPTTLLSYMLKACNVGTLGDIHRLVYSGKLTRPDIAALAASVSEAAEAGDAVAEQILASAGKELGSLAIGVLQKLGWTQELVEVGMVGGVFRAGPRVLEPFTKAVHSANPIAQILPARIPAAAGATLLALEELGINVDDTVLANVQSTLADVGPVKS
jgi:N-acetylglucosamine kinase-like BadF-type ATPase